MFQRRARELRIEPDVANTEAGLHHKDNVLEAEHLSVVYQSSRGPQRAVDDLSLSIRAGEFVSILGPSGCGKSTFLNVVAGLLQPSSGGVKVLGETVASPRADVGVVFQKPTLLPWATVLENVLIPVRALRQDVAAARPRAQELLALVGLQAFAHHYPDELSGGMQQRVGIARALIRDPAILLMDEPFAALDAMTRERMSIELQDIWTARRKTVLFITHSIPEAVFLSDRVLVMTPSPGRLHAEIIIDLPRLRSLDSMSSPAFGAICGKIRRMFNDQVKAP
ncbi:ABC transporter ATP-binding protein [Bradyrhizobium sp. dw_78]|uniref:ABC transporter ATP-binding protein n=1 Tax=Bradyrhizobium sp. dw_78 TaxID=2719793 RepID=UPI001BD5E138|nr:ABC transporter ATP-binding protein [Bradyrhizobium sp. dw_78]